MDGTNGSNRGARVILADSAREIRARFRASRKPVSNALDLVVARRRGLKTADGLAMLAGTMLDGGYSQTEASGAIAKLGERIVAQEVSRRAS